MTLKIAQLGQPVLRKVAAKAPIEEIGTPSFQKFLDDMVATLAQAKGVGLAAPQVFASVRVFLARVLPPADPHDLPVLEVLINPRIVWVSPDLEQDWEGCLSFPELAVLVPRHQALRVDYYNRKGEPCSLELEGYPARVIQHEYDHLEGVLTIDRAESTLDIVKSSELEAAIDARAEEEEELDDED